MKQPANRLDPEDQKKVNNFLSQGVNATERKPFRLLTLLGWLLASIILLGILSQTLGHLILT